MFPVTLANPTLPIALTTTHPPTHPPRHSSFPSTSLVPQTLPPAPTIAIQQLFGSVHQLLLQVVRIRHCTRGRGRGGAARLHAPACSDVRGRAMMRRDQLHAELRSSQCGGTWWTMPNPY